ncbi:chemotaxis protein MotB [Alphaproteobacteria bacterium GH1-50]|uniref:Chemotaxis protein MotB n=1 Tax=Kangsaoukella pontilimi TaxID=2691042 RepID=A0A7C9MAN3_9RHOB|nr:flagellar motor protein MotB [Kangsaoukella pontilimi]MXQ08153.1 chemotaxis protein MotB [Kangsaoukella pontilimi]
MAADAKAPIIVKRKKIIQGGHHGGAWKVAYADFVTAMMAFFLLMWLLGATNEKQRKGIADYFNPSIPINKVSGGGDGAFGGDSVFTEVALANSGTGAALLAPGLETQNGTSDLESEEGGGEASFDDVQAALSGRGGESLVSDLLARHIISEISDEGLIVELFATPDAPLFQAEAPTPLLTALLEATAEAARLVRNEIAIEVHVAAGGLDPWSLSVIRSDGVRSTLVGAGLPSARFQRITGFGAGQPVMRDPGAPRNERVEVILLRHRL